MSDGRETVGYVRAGPGAPWVKVEVSQDADEEEREQAALDALAQAQEHAEGEANQR